MPTLQFKGKSIVQSLHLTVPYHQLVPDAAVSHTRKPRLDDNLIIRGDNLTALKALLPTFGGKVKCIYIDPPYNTGHEDWRYNDNVNSPMHQEWLGETVGREDLTRHDKWLCMMLPRLRLLHELLRQDGVIFISIDDNEAHRLRMLMDEIFGEQNFLAQLVWEKTRKNDARFFSLGHDYMIVYARDESYLRSLNTYWREDKPGAKEIQQEYIRLRALFGEDDEAVTAALRQYYSELPRGHPAKKHSRYGNVDSRGVWRDDNMSWPGGGGPMYEVIHPITGRRCAVPEGGWRYSTPEKMEQMIKEGVVVFREDHTEPPIRKTYLVRSLTPSDDEASEQEDNSDIGIQVMGSYFYKSAQPASKLLTQIFGSRVFENPKDHEVIARMIKYTTSPDEGDVILDSFAGSGTTGHAVLALNAEDGGNRRFILVEQEEYAESITAERVRRVIRGVPEVRGEALQQGYGGTFSFFRLGDALDEEALLSGDSLPAYLELARYAFFTATGEQLEESKVEESRYYLGTSSRYEVYMIYQPDVDFLKTTPLTLSWAESLGPAREKPRLVLASHKYLDEHKLRELKIEFSQLPFAIYRFQG
ncbi:MAG TPA: site-specific DNA-methyltransferase [Ardenticatenaceae bacterium]|jgi:adenine-specific DNA-methyltransferase